MWLFQCLWKGMGSIFTIDSQGDDKFKENDICTIPPCAWKVKLLDFTKKHVIGYINLWWHYKGMSFWQIRVFLLMWNDY
jgi:hypothetical protein